MTMEIKIPEKRLEVTFNPITPSDYIRTFYGMSVEEFAFGLKKELLQEAQQTGGAVYER